MKGFSPEPAGEVSARRIDEPINGQMPEPMRAFAVQVAFWMALCFLTEAISGWIGHWGYPYNNPMLPKMALFGDFRSYVGKFAFFHSRAFFDGPILTYPAPTASLFKVFLPGRAYPHVLIPTLRYIGVILASSCAALLLYFRALTKAGLNARSAGLFCAGLYLTSYPLWFEVHQGNIEFAVWIVLMVGIWAHVRSRAQMAATCFGVAGAMKLFPFLFFGLLLARRQYRQAAAGILVAAVCTVAGLWLLCPDVMYSWRQTQAALGSLRPDPLLELPGLVSGFDHSLWVLVKRCFPTLPAPVALGRVLNLYFGLVGCAGCILFFARIRKLPVVNQVMTLTIASILFPPVSYDYTLLHLYAPFALMTSVVLAGRDTSKAMVTTMALFAFLLSWQSEFIAHGVRFGGQLKALALLSLFCVALVHRFELPATLEGAAAASS